VVVCQTETPAPPGKSRSPICQSPGFHEQLLLHEPVERAGPPPPWHSVSPLYCIASAASAVSQIGDTQGGSRHSNRFRPAAFCAPVCRDAARVVHGNAAQYIDSSALTHGGKIAPRPSSPSTAPTPTAHTARGSLAHEVRDQRVDCASDVIEQFRKHLASQPSRSGGRRK